MRVNLISTVVTESDYVNRSGCDKYRRYWCSGPARGELDVENAASLETRLVDEDDLVAPRMVVQYRRSVAAGRSAGHRRTRRRAQYAEKRRAGRATARRATQGSARADVGC